MPHGSTEKNRDMAFDLLRITACFMVVFLHVSAGNWYGIDVTSFRWKVFNFYDSLVRGSVPLFVMISGAFLLGRERGISTDLQAAETAGRSGIKEFYKTKVLRLVVVYIFWSVLYALLTCLFSGEAASPEFLKLFIQNAINSRYHLWYIPMLIGLYILTPLLRAFCRGADKQVLQYAVGLFAAALFLNSVLQFTDLPYYEWIGKLLNKFPIDLICKFPFYFITGYYFYRYDVSGRVRRLFYVLGAASVLVCAAASNIVSVRTGEASDTLYGFLQITSFLEAVALFIFFKNAFRGRRFSVKAAAVIAELSGCTFGIYLMHDLVMSVFREFKVISTLDFNPVLSVPAVSVCVFALTLAAVFPLRRIKVVSRWLM
ncbi:MAG: acyltransferase family protein [Oscillospiraceae bacterium]|jgi:surface polysaccharide O-acyltransferase-like enzyme|nr:acyltransferase family protein [Oscillospiraceae bacterium]